RCVAETFKDFPPSTVVLIDSLLSLEPEVRGTASSALQSDFFKTEPLACDPSSLPKFPASKEYDVRLRQEEERRQRKAALGGRGAECSNPGNENHVTSRAVNGAAESKNHGRKLRRIHHSGPLVPPGGNIEDMLKEHERHIQEAVRKARLGKTSR
uniref:Uncharacterized protein n=1 Tax=Aegilops tauschii subsp. strangulata TaxID=200361 RepID=A0A453K5K0_AEGTS